MKCKNCGYESEKEQKYCEKCGADLTEQQEKADKNKKIRKTTVAITCVILAIIMSVTAVIIVNPFSKELTEEQAQKIVDVYESEELKDITERYKKYAENPDEKNLKLIQKDAVTYFDGLNEQGLFEEYANNTDEEMISFTIYDCRCHYSYAKPDNDTMSGNSGSTAVKGEKVSKPSSTSNSIKALIINSVPKDNKENKELFNHIDTLSKTTYDNDKPTWLNYFNSYGIDVDIITGATVEDYKTMLQGYDFISLFSHGIYADDAPMIQISEKSTWELNKAYSDDLKNTHRVVIAGGIFNLGGYYNITPTFISYYYGNDKLKNSIVYFSICHGSQSDKMSKAFINSGASSFAGYTETVNCNYAFDTYFEYMYNLITGKNVAQAHKKAVAKYGKNDKKDNKYKKSEDAPAASFVTSGNDNASLSGILDIETSKTVKKLTDKIDCNNSYGHSYLAYLFENGDFDKGSIPNNVILRMGLIKLKEGENGDFDYCDYVNDFVDGKGAPDSFSAESLQSGINEIFGNNIKYKLQDFELYNLNGEYNNLIGYDGNDYYKIEYKNNKFIKYHCEGGGGDTPFIHLSLYRAEEINGKIKIYLKKAFVNSYGGSESTDYKFIYTYYNSFKNGKFVDEVTTIPADTVYNWKDNFRSVICRKTSEEFDNIEDKLDCCCFTFSKDDDGEYYLTGFQADAQLAKSNERKDNLDNMKATENTQKAVISRKQQTTKETTTTTTTTALDENEIYQKIIDKYEKQFIKYHEQGGVGEQYRCGYTEYDIDNNGIDELIIEDYTCEGDRCFHFYTIKNNKSLNIGEFDEAVHTGLYDNTGTLMSVEGSGGLFTTYSFSIKNDEINYTKVISQSNIRPDYCTSNNSLHYKGFVWFVY